MEKYIVTKWLRSELRCWYGKKNITSRLAFLTHSRLCANLAPVELDNFLRTVDKISRSHHQHLRNIKSKKIRVLINEKNGCLFHNSNNLPPHQFYRRVVNLSSVSFSPQEEQLLEKGPQTLPPSSQKDISS